METTWIIIGLLSLLILLVSIILFKKTTKATSSDKEERIIELSEELATKKEEIKNLREKIEEKKSLKIKEQEVLKKEFENLANNILETNSDKFQKQNKKEIDSLLKPLSEKIKEFQAKVESTNKEDIERSSSLITQIKSLKEQSNKLSDDSKNLTKALTGESKTQGNWGEYRLEVLLEKVGLKKDIHYSKQDGYKDEDSNLKKPDVIINLPDKKHLIIDSKVSLTAYERYYNEEEKVKKEAALKEHINSIKKHYKELGEKNYPDLYEINTPDFVLMFVPIEPALLTAFDKEQNLFIDALEKNIVLVSNSTLLATLSTVASVWKQEDQKKNALEIAKAGGLLYDKFEGFVQDLLDIGNKINSSQNSYKSAMEKLTKQSGNLVWQVERLKILGAKTKKSIPQRLLDKADEK
ncbi:MAG TPA: DNA recombination protein RmuC [Flavobacteriales bacterium]|jgi:DNA recombination protein RmuC|nr:DNA recombination protein RmuC [Flavobacteriales bacterium]|tara:strand:- start:5869 stop:7095 length:1227 start_codon:yes stop_codon:yes gene_type:complete